MQVSTNQGVKLNGFYRGKVVKHCISGYGRCKVFIPGVYPDEIDGPHRIKRIQDIIIEDGKAKPKEVNMEEKDENFVYFSMSYNITTKL